MTLAGLPPWGAELLAGGRVGHLAFVDSDDRPRVQPVTYAVLADQLVTAVDHKPKRVAGAELARVRWLRRAPAAALTVDRYDEDWEALAWVQVLGAVAIRESDPEGLAALVAKYPQYAQRPPGGPFLRLVPARVLHWRAVSAAG